MIADPASTPGAVVTLRFFGQVVIVDAGDPSLAAVVRTLWHPFLSTGAPAADLSQSTEAVHIAIPAGGTPAEDLGWLNSALNSTAMDHTPHLAVHAGVVRRGEVVAAFPAHSGVGKSTLTGACLREGFDYVSDEALCLSYDTGLVQPYPRPIGLSAWSARELGVAGVRAGDDLLVLPDEFGSRSTAIDEPLRLTHVMLPRRVDGTQVIPGIEATLTSASAHEAVEALLRMSFNHYRRPADAVSLVASVVGNARVNVLSYCNAADAATLLSFSPLVNELLHP